MSRPERQDCPARESPAEPASESNRSSYQRRLTFPKAVVHKWADSVVALRGKLFQPTGNREETDLPPVADNRKLSDLHLAWAVVENGEDSLWLPSLHRFAAKQVATFKSDTILDIRLALDRKKVAIGHPYSLAARSWWSPSALPWMPPARTCMLPGASHIKNALKAGATPEEIMEVLKLCVAQRVQACNLSLPILANELQSGKGKSAGVTRCPNVEVKSPERFPSETALGHDHRQPPAGSDTTPWKPPIEGANFAVLSRS